MQSSGILDDNKMRASQITVWRSKGGVMYNPRKYSENENRNISKAFCAAIYTNIGPTLDIPAPDIGTSSQTMDWMVSKYQELSNNMETNKLNLGCFTGKSVDCGGSLGRNHSTGLGVALTIDYWNKHHEDFIDAPLKTYIIQGFGNVGIWTMHFLNKLGYTCLAVGDHTGYYKFNQASSVDNVELLKNIMLITEDYIIWRIRPNFKTLKNKRTRFLENEM